MFVNICKRCALIMLEKEVNFEFNREDTEFWHPVFEILKVFRHETY